MKKKTLGYSINPSKYPKTVKELLKFFKSDVDIHIREWYDYFDSVGIKVYVFPKLHGFVYSLDYDDNRIIYDGDVYFKTKRIEAEISAFEEAFKIREKQLNK